MSCGTGGKFKSVYTGNQVGDFNFVGDFNYVAGGPEGSGLSAGMTVLKFIPSATNRRPWLRQDAKFNDALLDACWPTIGLRWFVEITLTPEVVFRASNQAFYVQDADGVSRFVDARADRPPSISVSVGEWLASNYEVSDAAFALNNRDGFYNEFLPLGAQYRQWSGAKVNIYIGFGELRSNYQLLFEGQVTTKQGMTTTRDTVEVKAYDKLDLDEVPMPPRVYSSDNFPDIDDTYAGKPIPLVYGDWENDVPDAGSVNGICLNAADDGALAYQFKVSDISLTSLSAIYLHRGSRKEGEPGGPVSISMPAVTIDLANGTFTIPKGVDVLDSEISYSDGTETAGAGSGLNLIAAKDSSVDFVSARIQSGDRVLKRATGQYATVTTIAVGQLNLSGGITFADGDEYVILTRKYAFVKGDKLTVKCFGKSLAVVSVDRISDIDTYGPSIKQPTGFTLDFDQTYWMADDETKYLYHLTFEGELIERIAYTTISPSLANVSGISMASDRYMWLADAGNMTVLRFNVDSQLLGFASPVSSITGLTPAMTSLAGIAVQSSNRAWLCDGGTGKMFEVEYFAAVNPFVTQAFTTGLANVRDISVDEANGNLLVANQATNSYYRYDLSPLGTLISTTVNTVLASNVTRVEALAVAQDGTLFFVDQGTLTIYNYNEQSDVSTNPAYVARDLLQKFGGHTFAEFDLSWNVTARQLSVFKTRIVFDKSTNLISFVNRLLTQYNVVFSLRFNRFSLFWITFDNFVTTGKFVGEKDIKEGSFKPSKEMNQYFNSATASYNYRPYDSTLKTSDTYVSPAAISFAGKEVNRTIDMANVYRRQDLDRLLPLFVRLSAPEPEFVEVTFGFRVIRSQMQDFLTVHFDGDVNCRTGRKESGRRYDHVPCMIRKLTYDLGPMTVAMKLWSLGTTTFGDHIASGNTVGGENDTIVLSNIGRLGRISPIGTITGSASNSVTVQDVDGANAATRTNLSIGKTWESTYKVDIVDGTTKAILQTLTILSTSGGTITFVEDLEISVVPTVKNVAGFITGGHYLQYASYPNSTNAQRQFYSSLSKPSSSYPTSRTQEIEEQRGGVHSFDDEGIPYVLYPAAFVSY